MNKDKQRLLKALVVFLAEDNNGEWPSPATDATQRNSWEVDFDEPVTIAKFQDYGDCETWELEGLAYMEEYDDGETVTKEEYLAFVAAHPDYVTNLPEVRKAALAKIAEINKQVGAMIDQMVELADAAALEFSINLGSNGSLDLNSDWNSSRC